MVSPIEDRMCDDCTNNPNKQLRGVNACPQCRELHENYAKAMGKPSPFEEINVDAYYYASTNTRIMLPAYKTWDDVQDSYVKWNTLYIKWKGGDPDDDYQEFILDSELDGADMKQPNSFTIYDHEYNEVKREG